MISSIRPQQSYAVSGRTQVAAKSAEGKNGCGCGSVCTCSAAPSDSANISFSSPFSAKAESLLAATKAQAAALEGTLGDYEPGELIIQTKPGTTLSSQEGSVVSDFGAKVLNRYDGSPDIHKTDQGEFLHIKLPAGISVAEAKAAMAADERIAFAEPNHRFQLEEDFHGQAPQASGEPITNDPDAPKLWGMHNEGQTGGTPGADISAPEAWAVHTGRDQKDGGTLLAVIDTGIDYDHPDLKDNIWTNPGEIPGNGIDDDNNGVIDDVHGYNAYANNGDPKDGHSHGSHCAGTIAGQGNNGVGVVGVNHNANIMAVKIFSDSGSTTADAIIRGIQYATKMGARITSNSWGGTQANEGIKQAFAQSPALHLMAAGNNGTDNDRRPHYPSSYDLPNNIAVAATDHKDGIARFSCYGATSVDIGAPGVDIFSTVKNGGYDTYSGTSMATPHVAGATLLVADQYPGISNEELKERILGSADKIPSLAGKTTTGGRLNVAAAIAPKENDALAPALPRDFGAKSVAADKVVLGWTATGDDGWCGDAAGYDVRVSDKPIVDGQAAENQVSFADAKQLETKAPQKTGQLESLEYGVTPNAEGQKLYFALKVLDNVGNASKMGSIEVNVPAPPAQQG